MKKREGKIDRPFLFTLIALIAIGLLMVFSASMYYSTANGASGYSQFYRQAEFALLGLGIMYLLSRVNYKIFLSKRIYWTLFGVSVLLLLLVYVPGIGMSVNGARRWISLGVSFQPSEIVKMTGIIYIAATLYNYPEILKSKIGLNRGTGLLWGLCYAEIILVCALIVFEPSLSATMVIGFGMMCVLWYSGLSIKQFAPFALLGIAAVLFLSLTVSWRLARILSIFGQSQANYQIDQSLLGFGSGGLFGVGLGNGKQKLLYLPEIQNDFIFANIGEEFGLVGCIIVLALYTFLIYRGFLIGVHCKNKFGFLYTLSVMTVLGFQVFVNVAVATHTIPVTGMALPFISYGGTSIVILLATIGPILNISRSVKLKRRRRKRIENTNRSRRNRRAHLSGNSNSRGVKANV